MKSHQSFFQLFHQELPQPDHNLDRIFQVPFCHSVSFEMRTMQIYACVRNSFLWNLGHTGNLDQRIRQRIPEGRGFRNIQTSGG